MSIGKIDAERNKRGKCICINHQAEAHGRKGDETEQTYMSWPWPPPAWRYPILCFINSRRPELRGAPPSKAKAKRNAAKGQKTKASGCQL